MVPTWTLMLQCLAISFELQRARPQNQVAVAVAQKVEVEVEQNVGLSLVAVAFDSEQKARWRPMTAYMTATFPKISCHDSKLPYLVSRLPDLESI